jgi:hypothetical protein
MNPAVTAATAITANPADVTSAPPLLDITIPRYRFTSVGGPK